MITRESLLTAGYREHPHNESLCGNVMYQRRVRAKEGETLYFVQVYLWALPGRAISADVETRMYLPEGNQLVGSTGFTLDVHADQAATIEMAEAFLARAYTALGCVPDLHN